MTTIRWYTFALRTLVIGSIVGGCASQGTSPEAQDAGGGNDASSSGHDAANGVDASTNGGAMVTCGAIACDPVAMKLNGEAFDVLPACCVSMACGIEPSGATVYGVKVPEMCTLPEAPGPVDESCPSFTYEFPMLGASTEFVGCCLPTGRCGVVADLGSLALGEAGTLEVVDFGCQETSDFFVTSDEPPTCGSPAVPTE